MVIGAIGNVLSLPFKVVGGVLAGGGPAFAQGAVETDPAYFAKKGMFFSPRGVTNRFVGDGLTQIRTSGILGDFANIFKTGGFNKFLDKLLNSSLLRGQGKGLLIGGVAMAGFAAIMGYQALTSEYKKTSELLKGYSTADYSQSPLVHGICAAGGLGMLAGAIALIPGLGLSAMALPLILGGAGVYFVTRKTVDFCGSDLVKYPRNSLPWPFYLPFETTASNYRNTTGSLG
ncbi:MAG: hypothetical protein HY094_01665 [Candidatus Melainabacteria bacterium]|nr:hypothetical protein [Candidatus Melainabacteria bacterium]